MRTASTRWCARSEKPSDQRDRSLRPPSRSERPRRNRCARSCRQADVHRPTTSVRPLARTLAVGIALSGFVAAASLTSYRLREPRVDARTCSPVSGHHLSITPSFFLLGMLNPPIATLALARVNSCSPNAAPRRPRCVGVWVDRQQAQVRESVFFFIPLRAC